MTDEILDPGVAGFIQAPPEIPLLALKHLGSKQVGDEELNHQLIVCVCLRSPF